MQSGHYFWLFFHFAFCLWQSYHVLVATRKIKAATHTPPTASYNPPSLQVVDCYFSFVFKEQECCRGDLGFPLKPQYCFPMSTRAQSILYTIKSLRISKSACNGNTDLKDAGILMSNHSYAPFLCSHCIRLGKKQHCSINKSVCCCSVAMSYSL